MVERRKRLTEVYDYVRKCYSIHTQGDFAKSLRYSRPVISSALNGNEDYLTDKLFKNICDAFPVFSLDYLLHGTGSLLLDQERGVTDYYPSTVNEPTAPLQTTPIPQWADSLISIVSQQIKENEALHRELRQSIQSIHQLQQQLQTIIQTLTPPPPNEV